MKLSGISLKFSGISISQASYDNFPEIFLGIFLGISLEWVLAGLRDEYP